MRRSVVVSVLSLCCFLFFFNDTATTEIYTLSLHDALPIFFSKFTLGTNRFCLWTGSFFLDRKSTRLNSSHLVISYAVFCLKKKKKTIKYCIFLLSIPYDTSSLYCGGRSARRSVAC